MEECKTVTAYEQVTRFIDEKIGGLKTLVELDESAIVNSEASIKDLEQSMQKIHDGILARKQHMQELQSSIYELEKLKEKISK